MTSGRQVATREQYQLADSLPVNQSKSRCLFGLIKEQMSRRVKGHRARARKRGRKRTYRETCLTWCIAIDIPRNERKDFEQTNDHRGKFAACEGDSDEGKERVSQ